MRRVCATRDRQKPAISQRVKLSAGVTFLMGTETLDAGTFRRRRRSDRFDPIEEVVALVPDAARNSLRELPITPELNCVACDGVLSREIAVRAAHGGDLVVDDYTCTLSGEGNPLTTSPRAPSLFDDNAGVR